MRDIVNFKRSILRKMNAQTKKILTLVGVGVGAVLAYRFITKENSESKSNVGGNPDQAGTLDESGEWCWDGSRWNPVSSTSLCQGGVAAGGSNQDEYNEVVRLAAGSETCRCKDGTVYNCRRPGCCANYCSHLGGLNQSLVAPKIKKPALRRVYNRSFVRR